MMNTTVTKYSKVTSKDSSLFLLHGSTLLHSLQYETTSVVFVYKYSIFILIFALQNKKKKTYSM